MKTFQFIRKGVIYLAFVFFVVWCWIGVAIINSAIDASIISGVSFFGSLELMGGMIILFFGIIFGLVGRRGVIENPQFIANNKILEETDTEEITEYLAPGRKIKIIPKSSLIKILEEGLFRIRQDNEEIIILIYTPSGAIVKVKQDVIVEISRDDRKDGYVTLTY